jgi:hypothetical protein
MEVNRKGQAGDMEQGYLKNVMGAGFHVLVKSKIVRYLGRYFLA